ncbi:sialate O-acetylesterase [Gillisia sp. M10.2A]|uniref:Sialate O-acetylesterase n=1 Tax=Gillisia lutea TaxID=2909668 RepID=A0ABS9EEB6_9FLAO|nr:sialate O-acetylesterase [Gillisia lutea]MCF4101186.1 sialate O-acetylesterase [Gillisia lutea]
MKLFRSLTLLLFLMLTTQCFSNVSLPSIFSDNMVLQRNADVKIWGWAKPGEEIKIKVSWDEKELTTKPLKTSYWEIILSTPDIRGAQEITISGYNEVKLKNVLLGEVWLVSGQSNMEWSANSGIDNAEEEIANARNNQIRFYTVANKTAECPQQDLDGNWEASTPQTMKYFSAIAYFFGRKMNEELNVPIGLINSTWGGTPAEVWMPEEIIKNNETLSKAAKLIPDVEWGPRKPASIYNAMIAPIIPFKIKGILWYQGESNTDNADYYETIFSSLINSWREKWNEDLPFYYAQIAPYDYGEGFSGVKVRDAQRRVLKLPNTGMVMTSDIGNIKNIHPSNKIDVGLRFANLALTESYGKKLHPYAPLFERAEADGKNLKIYFKYNERLYLDKQNTNSQFEIAGTDRKFYPAKVSIKNDVVVLRSSKVKKPMYVRYSWGNTSTSNIFNHVGLPASSFTTEY